jgi:hypothetical protein
MRMAARRRGHPRGTADIPLARGIPSRWCATAPPAGASQAVQEHQRLTSPSRY